MTRDSTLSRRKTMKLAGATAATALVAGCSSDDNNGGDGDGGNGGDDTYEIDPDTTIELEANIGGWQGVAPSAIEGTENPTLVLEADADYEIGWNEGDGNQHNIQLRNESDEVVDDYETELSAEGGDDQFISFTATEEIVKYRCQPHSAMEGEIQVQ
ncbi:cupredoxin domain-containing protein [Halosolutus halophilus]|uniref:cupredoxin domain-containing protein n=1 Tax=Halosolutus halophilus TaxID=1552990 RepID=UPI0022352B62|nr:plastocyanin/azurin family copper-binding protein [Halosolutus halophilus]